MTGVRQVSRSVRHKQSIDSQPEIIETSKILELPVIGKRSVRDLDNYDSFVIKKDAEQPVIVRNGSKLRQYGGMIDAGQLVSCK